MWRRKYKKVSERNIDKYRKTAESLLAEIKKAVVRGGIPRDAACANFKLFDMILLKKYAIKLSQKVSMPNQIAETAIS